MSTAGSPATAADLTRTIRTLARGTTSQSAIQAGVTVTLTIGAFGIMYWLAGLAWWAPLPLAPLVAFLVVRLFIFQHDCGHGSYFRNAAANTVLGHLCSVFTWAPYTAWRRQHAGHHTLWNRLDRRASGLDIYSSCLTVREFRALTPAGRRRYRLTRHPVVANILLPPLIFMVLYRFPFDTPRTWRGERRSVYATTAAIAGVLLLLSYAFGFQRVASVHIPVIVIASIIGVWLFSVQHRAPDIAWLSGSAWNPVAASLRGATYLALPPTLHWLTGNIGYHHIHHLNPKAPNYRLAACHRAAAPFLQGLSTHTLGSAFRALSLILWDEDAGRLVAASEAATR